VRRACLAVASFMLHKRFRSCSPTTEFCNLFWDE
jgi:hypothetical protein